METILQRFRDSVDELSENAAKEIEEKYIGKGAVVLSTIHGEKATLKEYTICFPTKVFPRTLSMQSDTKFVIKLLSKDEKRFASFVKIKCRADYDRTFYNDTIQFIDEQVVDDICAEVMAFFPEQIVTSYDVYSAVDGILYHKIANHLSEKVSGAKEIEVSSYINQLREKIKSYINGDIKGKQSKRCK